MEFEKPVSKLKTGEIWDVLKKSTKICWSKIPNLHELKSFFLTLKLIHEIMKHNKVHCL